MSNPEHVTHKTETIYHVQCTVFGSNNWHTTVDSRGDFDVDYNLEGAKRTKEIKERYSNEKIKWRVLKVTTETKTTMVVVDPE